MNEKVTPLVTNTYQQSKANNALQEYWDSKKANEACAEVFSSGDKAETAYHERCLPQCVKDAVQQFGAERCKVILAGHIQTHTYDGRYSRAVKAAAEAVKVPDNFIQKNSYGRDGAVFFRYELSAHPCILNQAFSELTKQLEKQQTNSLAGMLSQAAKTAASVNDGKGTPNHDRLKGQER